MLLVSQPKADSLHVGYYADLDSAIHALTIYRVALSSDVSFDASGNASFTVDTSAIPYSADTEISEGYAAITSLPASLYDDGDVFFCPVSTGHIIWASLLMTGRDDVYVPRADTNACIGLSDGDSINLAHYQVIDCLDSAGDDRRYWITNRDIPATPHHIRGGGKDWTIVSNDADDNWSTVAAQQELFADGATGYGMPHDYSHATFLINASSNVVLSLSQPNILFQNGGHISFYDMLLVCRSGVLATSNNRNAIRVADVGGVFTAYENGTSVSMSYGVCVSDSAYRFIGMNVASSVTLAHSVFVVSGDAGNIVTATVDMKGDITISGCAIYGIGQHGTTGVFGSAGGVPDSLFKGTVAQSGRVVSTGNTYYGFPEGSTVDILTSAQFTTVISVGDVFVTGTPTLPDSILGWLELYEFQSY